MVTRKERERHDSDLATFHAGFVLALESIENTIMEVSMVWKDGDFAGRGPCLKWYKLKCRSWSLYDLTVGQEDGNYAGGDKTIEGVNKEACRALFREWFGGK